MTGTVSTGKLGTAEVYKVTDCKMVSLRGYSPDEERVQEVRGCFSYGYSNYDSIDR